MMQAEPIHTDLVLVGGGHTHAIVLRQIGMGGLPPGVRVTLITNLVDTPYSGMLPCHISGLYSFDESHIDLRPLTRFARCQLLMDEMVGLDTEHQQIFCRQHPPLRYDVLSIDIGSTPATVTVPGAKEYAIPAKPVPQLLMAWEQYLQSLTPESTATIGIVGGGVGGVELAMNMQVRLWERMPNQDQVVVHLFHRGDRLATGRNRWTQRHLEWLFRKRNIQVHLGESVVAVEPSEQPSEQKQVRCESGLTVSCDRIFWVTNAAAPAWIQQTDLSTDAEGFILVRDTLQTYSHPNIFAAGDIATMKHHPRPKAGVFAVRQGKPLYQNLYRFLNGERLKPFIPQRQFLNIIDTGTGTAIASRGPFAGESRLFRWWKDWIDSRFMDLFRKFPEMSQGGQGDKGTRRQGEVGAGLVPAQGNTFAIEQNQHPTSKMYCAGCASKVSQAVLRQVLNRLQVDFGDSINWPGRDLILAGLDVAEDAAVVQVPAGKLMVQTVDQFRALVDDPFVFGQICVNHCLSDLFAMGAMPQSVLAIATIPYGTDEKQTETLYQLLAGSYQILAQSQTFLVGGHTTEGAELALGFACQGWVEPEHMLRKDGLQPGQDLILTKPLGTGTLFAADMQFAAKGRWIQAAVQSMVQSNQAAVEGLRFYGIAACTDVTGFGLVGHLLEMVQASGVAVDLELTALPVLPGAHSTLAAGYVSSLHHRNQRVEAYLDCPSSMKPELNYPLLFDPQTAGGLLIAVPKDRREICLQTLHQLGYSSSRCIGTVVEAKPGVAPITINQRKP